MSLTKKDLELIAGLINTAMDSKPQDNKNAGVKIEGKPKDLLPSTERPNILQKLTMKERVDFWGEINKDNVFGNKYSCSRKLYKGKNIDGRPSITYPECINEFLLPIATHLKYTNKQITILKKLMTKALEDKIEKQKNPRAKEWLEKGLEAIPK